MKSEWKTIAVNIPTDIVERRQIKMQAHEKPQNNR